MTFDLGLSHNLSSLALAARSNQIYLGHLIAVITPCFDFKYEIIYIFNYIEDLDIFLIVNFSEYI